MRNKIALFLLLPPLICTGCIGENNDDCPLGLYVTFETRNPKHSYVEAVRNVDLYFYDADGNLAASYDYTKDELRPSDGAAYVADPPRGEYLLLAVVNDGADVGSVDVEKYSTIRSEFKNREIRTQLKDFFSAERQVTVSGGRRASSELMVLDKYNNDVRLHVEYDEEYTLPTGATLESYITCNNGVYEFRTRKCLNPCPVRYEAWRIATNVETRLPSQFTISTMHIWQQSSDKGECDVTVFLHESGLPMDGGRTVSVNLTQELLKIKDPITGESLYDTDEKLLFEDEYDVTVTIGKEFNILALTINNWSIISGDVEI